MKHSIPVTVTDGNELDDLFDQQPNKEEVHYFDKRTYTKEKIPNWKLKTLYVLASIAVAMAVWIILSILVPSSKDDIFIRGVKNVKKADANLDTLLLEVKNNARDIDAAYSDIQKNGNGARFYSKYNIQAGSGSIVITYSNYENQAKTQETDSGTGN